MTGNNWLLDFSESGEVDAPQAAATKLELRLVMTSGKVFTALQQKE